MNMLVLSSWFKSFKPSLKKKLLHIIAQCSAEPPSTITTGGCFYRWLCAQDRPSPKKTRYQPEVQIVFHHKTVGGVTRSDTETLCSFQVEVQWGQCSPPHKDGALLPSESRCSIQLALLFLPWKEEPFKSWHCHLSSKPSHYAKKDKKGERAGRGHTNCRFSLVALAITDLWNSSPVSSTKSFKEKTCQSENSSSLQLRRAGSTTARSTSQRQRERRKTLPASLPLLCFQPRNFLGEMCEFLSTD